MLLCLTGTKVCGAKIFSLRKSLNFIPIPTVIPPLSFPLLWQLLQLPWYYRHPHPHVTLYYFIFFKPFGADSVKFRISCTVSYVMIVY